MLDVAKSASVHALTGSSKPGTVPPFVPAATAAIAAPRVGMTARGHTDQELIDLAERVVALSARIARFSARVDLLQGATIAETQSSGVRAGSDVSNTLLPAQRAAENRSGLTKMWRLRGRMTARLSRWAGRVTEAEPATQQGVAAKSKAFLQLQADGRDWLANAMGTALGHDAIRVIGAEADARAEEHRQADSELLALGRAWRDCADRHEAAFERRDEIDEQLTLPPCPPALLFSARTDPPALFAYSRMNVAAGLLWYGDQRAIAELRGAAVQDFCRPRRDEILGTYDAWAAEQEAVAAAAGRPEAVAAVTRIADEHQALRRRIVSLPAQTIEGLKVKAAVASWCLGGTDSMMSELAIATAAGVADDDAFALSVLLDLPRVLELSLSAPAGKSPAITPADRLIARYPGDVSPEVIESYRAFLEMELRFLNHEIYGRTDGRLHLWLNNPAGSFHGGGERPASTRAAAVLDLFGLLPTPEYRLPVQMTDNAA